jgi:hypothetical protein
MKYTAVDSHRGLLYALFAIFETLLVVAVVLVYSVDPRRMSGLDDAAGIAFCFSFFGLSGISWLLRGAAPRLARVGWISVLATFLAFVLLPPVP